jgi:SpoVK/Ycf46/Vps4 family AAA+-type ATPase
MTDPDQQLPPPGSAADMPDARKAPRLRTNLAPPPPSTAALWILRVLVRGRALPTLAEHGGWPDEDVIDGLGLRPEVAMALNDPRRSGSIRQFQALFTRWLDELEKVPPPRDQPLFRNVAWLGERLGLSRLEQDLLAFASLLHTEPGLFASFRGKRTGSLRGRAHELLAHMLSVDVEEVTIALRSEGALASLRLLQIGGPQLVHVRLDVAFSLDEALDTALRVEHPSPDALLARFFKLSAPATLTPDDYSHVRKQVDLMISLIAKATERRSQGVNVLVFGPPGTGKTELARTVAAATGTMLHEVGVSDEDEDPANGKQRLTGYCVCQRMLARAPRSIVLFDEIEDAFPRSFMGALGLKQDSHPTKGWINRTLETNPVPAIWIGNHADQLDPAFLRRFRLVVELPDPPPRVRARVLRRHVGALGVSDAWIDRHSSDARLRPGHVRNAALVAEIVAPPTAEAAEQILSDVLEGTLALEGPPDARSADDHACGYDPTLVNADIDVDRVVQGLERERRGTVCLYGPPGAGKTAFVNHLANRLGMPLLARRASDLLGMYVGQTEARIAAMFREATMDGALLFLDEADGFLQSRSRATHQWEITQVNELLVATERFNGLFVCATNLMDTLDPAVHRRLTLKIRFSPLSSDQRSRMLAATLARLEAPTDPNALSAARADLERLSELTAGDFTAVSRRLRLLGGPHTAADVIRGLEEEHRLKPGGAARRAGFGVGRLRSWEPSP